MRPPVVTRTCTKCAQPITDGLPMHVNGQPYHSLCGRYVPVRHVPLAEVYRAVGMTAQAEQEAARTLRARLKATARVKPIAAPEPGTLAAWDAVINGDAAEGR